MLRTLPIVCAVIAASIIPPGVSAAQGPREAATFTQDVAPVLQRSCQGCHNPGGIGPMPLVTYEQVAADFMTDIGPVSTGLAEDRSIQALEVREVARDPGRGAAPAGSKLNYFLVHHASISIADAERAADAGPGDEGSGRRLVFCQMGQNPTTYPAGVGTLLPAGSALDFAVHVHSVGEALPLRLDIAFKFVRVIVE